MFDIEALIGANTLRFIVKISMLSLIMLYIIFSYIVYAKLRSLNNLVFVRAKNASRILTSLVFIHFLLSLSLFLIALVIL